MNVDFQLFGTFFGLKYIEAQEITTKAGGKRYKLSFASPLYARKTGELLKVDEAQKFIGACFNSKVDIDFIQRHKDALKPGNCFDITAAIDSYSMDGGAHGVWFSILEMRPSTGAAPIPNMNLPVAVKAG